VTQDFGVAIYMYDLAAGEPLGKRGGTPEGRGHPTKAKSDETVIIMVLPAPPEYSGAFDPLAPSYFNTMKSGLSTR
jgi:hypothetical protein